MTDSGCGRRPGAKHIREMAARLKCRIKHRLTSTWGVTLGEMLVSVLIMSLLTLAVSAGVGTAAKVYRSEKAYSESRVLSNSLLLAITEELRYASNLELSDDGSQAHYDSAFYGTDTVMRIQQQDGAGGRLALVYDEDQVAYPFDDKTYMEYQIVENGERPLFELGGDGACLTLSYHICDAQGNVKASLEGVKIRLLNPTEEDGSEASHTP